LNENNKALIAYIKKLETEYLSARNEFFNQEHRRRADLYIKTPKKKNMFKILKQKIEDPNYTIPNRLLISLGEVTYIKEIIFKLDDLLALITYGYFHPFSQKFNEFLELVVVLDKFFEDHVKFVIENFHYHFHGNFEGSSREIVDSLFEEDSYKHGYHNIHGFYRIHAGSDIYSIFNYEQAVMIKIVKNKLKIVYNKKARTWYCKGIDKFNRKGYKFDLEKERLKRDNQEWYFAFLNKYYFRDETLNELSDKIFLSFLEDLKTSPFYTETLPFYIKERFNYFSTQIDISKKTKKLEARFLIFLDLLSLLQEHKYVAFYNLIDAIGKESVLSKFHTPIRTKFFNYVAESEKLNQEAKIGAMNWLLKIAIKTGLLTDYIDLYFKAMNTFPDNNKFSPFHYLITSVKITELLKLNAFQLEKQFLDLIQSIGTFKHNWVPYQSFLLLLKVAKATDFMKKHYSLLLDVFPKLPDVGKQYFKKFHPYKYVLKEAKSSSLKKEKAFKMWKKKNFRLESFLD